MRAGHTEGLLDIWICLMLLSRVNIRRVTKEASDSRNSTKRLKGDSFPKRGHHITWQAACHKHFNGFFVWCENMYHSLQISWASSHGHLFSFPCTLLISFFFSLRLTLNGSGKYPNLTVSLDQTRAVHSVSHVNAETLPRPCTHAKHTACEAFQKGLWLICTSYIFKLKNSLGTLAKHKHKHAVEASSNMTLEMTQPCFKSRIHYKLILRERFSVAWINQKFIKNILKHTLQNFGHLSVKLVEHIYSDVIWNDRSAILRFCRKVLNNKYLPCCRQLFGWPQFEAWKQLLDKHCHSIMF